MKKFLFFCFLCQSILVFAQSSTNTQPATTNFKTYGYIDGKRLDSIDAEYAEFGWRNSSLTFNYGQLQNSRKEVKNSKGESLVFVNYNKAFALNFFYFNGWQLDHIYNDPSDNNFIFLLKKSNSQ